MPNMPRINGTIRILHHGTQSDIINKVGRVLKYTHDGRFTVLVEEGDQVVGVFYMDTRRDKWEIIGE